MRRIVHWIYKIIDKDYRYFWEGRKFPSGEFKGSEKWK